MPEQTLFLITKICKLRTQRFYNIGPRMLLIYELNFFLKILPKSLSKCKTRNKWTVLAWSKWYERAKHFYIKCDCGILCQTLTKKLFFKSFFISMNDITQNECQIKSISKLFFSKLGEIVIILQVFWHNLTCMRSINEINMHYVIYNTEFCM